MNTPDDERQGPPLPEVASLLQAEADAVFTAERLARQHARILQRLEQEGRPGRVIAFPLAGGEGSPLRTRPAARWIAGAAAAGLLIGLLAGHLAHDLPLSGSPEEVRTATNRAPQVPVARRTVTISDDQFLTEIETALDSPGGSVVRTLHEITPQ